MKLSNRLKKIESMVPADSYTHIWDCCCDHGLLGAALLSRHKAPHIHFVDIVPELIDKLESKLQRFYQNLVSNWQVHCLDVADLPIGKFDGNHLVIIAGVGGDLLTQLVTEIHQNHPATEIDFLLCPVYHQFTLRQQLIELDFNLKLEVLIEDNHRFYEILLVTNVAKIEEKLSKVSPVGELIWQADSDEQTIIIRNYLNKTLNHYQRIQQHKNADIQNIIEAYRSVAV